MADYLSSCHICRIPTPGALILNHLQEAKTTEKSWSLTINSKFNAICCWDAAVLHPNKLNGCRGQFIEIIQPKMKDFKET